MVHVSSGLEEPTIELLAMLIEIPNNQMLPDIRHCSYPNRQSMKMVDSKDARTSLNQAQ